MANYLMYKMVNLTGYPALIGERGAQAFWGAIARFCRPFATLIALAGGTRIGEMAENGRKWPKSGGPWWTLVDLDFPKVHHEKRHVLNLKIPIWWTLVDLFVNPRIMRARLRMRARGEGKNPQRSTNVHHLNLSGPSIWWTFDDCCRQFPLLEAR